MSLEIPNHTPQAITSGFFFHAARKDPQEGYKTVVEGQPVFIHPSSSLMQQQPDWWVWCVVWCGVVLFENSSVCWTLCWWRSCSTCCGV